MHTENTGITLTIEALSDKGEGTGTYQGMTYFVPETLPGEQVQVMPGEPFVSGSRRAPARLIKLVQPHPERIIPPCPYAHSCGGCLLPHASQKLQLTIKEQLLRASLNKAGLACVQPEPMFSLPEQYQGSTPCRYKTIRRFALQDGHIVNGFYKVRSHELCAVSRCLQEPAWFSDFAQALCALADEHKLTVYDEASGTGCLRALLLREGDSTERMAVLIAAQALPEVFVTALTALAEQQALTSLNVSLNTTSGNKVLGDGAQCLYGRPYLTKTFEGIAYQISPLSFLQVNHDITAQLYRQAVQFCTEATEHDRALDLCCGAGTMTLLLSRHFRQVTGVEIVESAVQAARANAQRNDIHNADFVCQDFTDYLAACRSGQHRVNAVIADPARTGLGAANCQALLRMPGPLKLSLIFCSLKALERDLKILCRKGGFRVRKVQGFDMFPQTMHLETMVLLEK